MDEILEKLKNHPDFSFLWSEHNPMLSLPGLEIDQMQRKVYCNSQEIKLTTKEYDLLCLLVANKGRVLTYDQIYQKIWKEEAFGNANNAIACHVHNRRAVLSSGVYGRSVTVLKRTPSVLQLHNGGLGN